MVNYPLENSGFTPNPPINTGIPVYQLTGIREFRINNQDPKLNFDIELQQSIDYLGSDKAIQSVEADPYWPKWDSPWWHMLLLHEMGETEKIPELIVEKYVSSLGKIPLKIFPIQPEDMPEGIDPYRDTPCHCQLGNVYQVLAKSGVDVDKELPWIRPWFLRYQMPDGGLNCDNEAYLVRDEVPSSMVATISVFEAVLLYTPRPWTTEEKIFLDKAAKFLVERKLMFGSPTKHNASERESAKNWLKLCFPRFYWYDVLRGINALLIWSEKTKQKLPPEAIGEVVKYLHDRFRDGNILKERYSYDGALTMLPSPSGEWIRRQPAPLFPLLTKVSQVGVASPFLTKQWAEAKERLRSVN